MPVATEISGDIYPEMIIDGDHLTPGVLSDDSSESASPHRLQILQQGTSGQRNKKIAKRGATAPGNWIPGILFWGQSSMLFRGQLRLLTPCMSCILKTL